MYSTATSCLPALVGNHAEKMQRIGMIRLDRENLPIDLLGRLQPAGLMVLDRNRQCFGNRCHRHIITPLAVLQMIPNSTLGNAVACDHRLRAPTTLRVSMNGSSRYGTGPLPQFSGLSILALLRRVRLRRRFRRHKI